MGSEPPGFKTGPNPPPVGAPWIRRPGGKLAGHDYEWLDHNRRPACNANERRFVADFVEKLPGAAASVYY